MTFPLVLDLAADGIPVAVTCGVLGFSRQAFYAWRVNPVSERDLVDAYATQAALQVHADDLGFGYCFVTDELGDLAQWITTQPDPWWARVTVASLEPFRGYATALSAVLPHAVLVLDRFHVIKLAFAAVDDVSRSVQQDTHGHRGRSGDPLYGIRRVLRRGAETLTDRVCQRLVTGLNAGDVGGQVAAAWIAAQDLRSLYRAPAHARAEALLYRLLMHCADARVPELTPLTRTLDAGGVSCSPPSDPGISNGPTEALILLIKDQARRARDQHIEVEATRGIYHRIVVAYPHPTVSARSRARDDRRRDQQDCARGTDRADHPWSSPRTPRR